MTLTAIVTDKPSVVLSWPFNMGQAYQVWRNGTVHSGLIHGSGTFEDFDVTTTGSYRYEVTAQDIVGSALVNMG
jgi:hypothetical protein